MTSHTRRRCSDAPSSTPQSTPSVHTLIDQQYQAHPLLSPVPHYLPSSLADGQGGSRTQHRTSSLAMERRRQRAVISRRYCVLGATLFSVCRGPTAVVVSAFGPRPSSSLGRTLAAAAAATAGNAKTPVRRGRRPRALSPSEALSATSRRTSPFVGEAPTSNMKDWRDLGPEVCFVLACLLLRCRLGCALAANVSRPLEPSVLYGRWYDVEQL